MPVERIQIIITERGTRRVIREVTRVGDAANRSAARVNSLRRALVAIGSAVAVRELIKLSDTFTQIENRLRLVTASTEQLRSVQQELFKVANETRSSFEATSELYTRVALSAKNLGVTQREVIGFTKALNQAVILSGASAQEARNGIIQFAQGLAANRLAGDELRAVLEQLPLVADVIAEELGVTRGSLRELAAQGKITATEILAAFGPETQKKIQNQFSQTIPTIAQALTVLQTSLIKLLGQINNSQGIFTALARGIIFISENFERFAKFVLGSLLIPGLIAATSAVKALTVALIANPFTAILGAISVSVGLLVAFNDQIKLSEGSLTTLGDVVISLGQEFGFIFQELFSQFSELASELFGLSADVDVSLKGILRTAAVIADGFVGVFVGAFFALGRTFQGIADIISFSITAAINGLIGAAESSINFIIRQLNVFRIKSLGQINEIIAGINRISERLGGGQIELFDVGAGFIDPVEFKKLENSLSDGGKNLGQSIKDGFVEGFGSVTGVQDLVERAITRADDRATRREIDRLDRERAARNGADPLDSAPPGGQSGLDDLQTIALREQIELLQREQTVIRDGLGLTEQQRAAKEDLRKIEEQLRRKNVELTDAQRLQLEEVLLANKALETQQEILGRLRGGAQQAGYEIDQLSQLFQDGRISVAEYNAELRRLRQQELAGNQDVFSGFERGLLSVQDTISNFGAQSEATLTNAFSSAEDALVNFVQTGKFEFSSLVDSVLADLTRLLARQAAFGLLASFGGGGGFAAAGGLNNFLFGGSPFGGARADGGPVRPDQAFLVGERGPEIFRPPSSGSIEPITPNAQTSMNVQIVNVTDPSEVQAALAQPGVQDSIVNVISRKKQAVRAALGI